MPCGLVIGNLIVLLRTVACEEKRGGAIVQMRKHGCERPRANPQMRRPGTVPRRALTAKTNDPAAATPAAARIQRGDA
ncbi:hypothetical protein BLTE_17270 [Blastochloris tepida]|uniref:Uncharacterized protein n=1 Tax=Blastochloris tepida TaxID=2233851 RepID=A0A348G0F9_9HYPH|nr:hypothetical protein BLTE_17270 [Blastochloris tepida]